VLMRRRRNLKFQGVMRHVARATRLAAVATSVLLILLLNWATVMAAVPSAPDITGPTGIQSSGDVTITWVAPPEGADSYNVAVYDWYNETWPLPSTNTDGCSYYVAGLMDNHGFIICVQAINADGPGPLAYSYFDVCSTGEAPSDQPVLTAPRALSDTDPGNPLDVTFTWDHVDKAGRYWLAVNEWHNTYWTTVFAVIVPDTGPGEPISYGPYTFLEGHYYSAWLMSANPVGAGPFNDCLYFGVSTLGHAPDAPTITQFAVEYSDAPIPLSDTQFEWSSTEKTLGYYFVLCDEDTNVEVGAWWQFDSGTGVNTFNLPSGITLVGGHLYWFGVAGWNPWGFGTWASVTFVAAAPLTVTADAQSKFYGADNPELTFTCSGLVNGDTADEVLTGGLSTTATTGSAAGTYPISQGTLAATGYYYIGMFNDANLTVIPDTTPPAISIWYPNNGVFLLGTVSIGGEITDSGSGVNWSTLSVTLNGMEYGAYHEDSFFCCEPSYLADGVYSLAVSVYDNAYNHATAQSTFTLDTTPPTITASVSPAPIAGWNNSDVTVTFQATDSGSGVASIEVDSGSGPILTDHVVVTTEGSGQVITGIATDNAGNTATTSVTVFISRVEILTPQRDASGNLTSTLVPTDVVSASYPRPIPHITSPQSTSAVTVANGQVSFTLAGYVSDAFADIVPNGTADLGSVVATVSSAPSLQQTITVTRDGNQTATLLRPYPFQGDFSDLVSFPALEGLHVLILQTGPNIIGRTGCTTIKIRLLAGEDLNGNTFLTVSELTVGNSDHEDFFQPFLVRVRGDKTLLDGNKCYLYDNELTLRGQPDNSVLFADQQNKPVVAAYLPGSVSINPANLSATKVIEASLDPILGYGKKAAIPITPARFIVPTSSQNAVRIHRPEVFNTLGLMIKNGSGAVLRQFTNIVPGDFLWDGKDSNGNALTEAQAPFTFNFNPQFTTSTGRLTPAFSISGIGLEENHWAFRIPGQPSTPDGYASGIDPDSISLNSLEIKVTPDGGLQKTVTIFSVSGGVGEGNLDADVYLDQADGKPLKVYATPYYPINLKYELWLKQKGRLVMDVTKNRWNMDPTCTGLATQGTQRFGVQPRADAPNVRELENNFTPGTEPIQYDY